MRDVACEVCEDALTVLFDREVEDSFVCERCRRMATTILLDNQRIEVGAEVKYTYPHNNEYFLTGRVVRVTPKTGDTGSIELSVCGLPAVFNFVATRCMFVGTEPPSPVTYTVNDLRDLTLRELAALIREGA